MRNRSELDLKREYYKLQKLQTDPQRDQVSLAKYIENGLRDMGWDDGNVADKCSDIQNALREVEKLIKDKKEKENE